MTTMAQNSNTLFYGDNLDILREHIADESVDLVYLDPPFNSNRSYNVLFKNESGEEAPAQIQAFSDTWHWNVHTENAYRELVGHARPEVAQMIEAMREFIGANQMMAYLVMMAARLAELHRILKSTGSLYLHCDPTASHYLKIVLDTIFGIDNYRNEITWRRTTAHSDATSKYADIVDTILFYGKSHKTQFRPLYKAHDKTYIDKFYTHDDGDGRGVYALDNMTSPSPRPNMMYEWKGFSSPPNGWRYKLETMKQLDSQDRINYPKHPDGSYNTSKRPRLKRYLIEQDGTIVSCLWDDIQPISAQATERLGYPTQKPLALLERIINASSNPGDVVMDPFCGCGTAIAAAHKLGRHWIGIDITHLSIALLKYRLSDAFGLVEKKDYIVKGEPEDLPGAQQLASEDRYQFQWWALSLLRAKPVGGDGGKEGKKGSDKGIDGVITFFDDNTNKSKRVIVQVKSGKVSSRDVRDLLGVLDREKAAIGVFVTLEDPTRDMLKEAAIAGAYHSPVWNQDYQRIQVLTIAEMLSGAVVKMPQSAATFKATPRIKGQADQGNMFSTPDDQGEDDA